MDTNETKYRGRGLGGSQYKNPWLSRIQGMQYLHKVDMFNISEALQTPSFEVFMEVPFCRGMTGQIIGHQGLNQSLPPPPFLKVGRLAISPKPHGQGYSSEAWYLLDNRKVLSSIPGSKINK